MARFLITFHGDFTSDARWDKARKSVHLGDQWIIEEESEGWALSYVYAELPGLLTEQGHVISFNISEIPPGKQES